jgi:hypothetical protein
MKTDNSRQILDCLIVSKFELNTNLRERVAFKYRTSTPPFPAPKSRSGSLRFIEGNLSLRTSMGIRRNAGEFTCGLGFESLCSVLFVGCVSLSRRWESDGISPSQVRTCVSLLTMHGKRFDRASTPGALSRALDRKRKQTNRCFPDDQLRLLRLYKTVVCACACTKSSVAVCTSRSSPSPR